MTKTCDYFFSPQSPYAYLGHERFVALAAQYGVQINLRPFDSGKVFAVSGGLPLGQRAPQRQAYRLIELARWSKALSVPMNLHPKYFPVSGDPAARLIIAAQFAHGTERALALTGAVMRAVWAEERNIADDATLVALAQQFDMDGPALLRAAAGASVQSTYDQYTQEAISANVFGMPWYRFRDEPFWGQDRLQFLEQAFAGAA